MRKESGFTLIEMLIVLTIINVLLMLSIPKMDRLVEKKQTDYFIEQFKDDMLYAQQYAMTHKSSVIIVFYDQQPVYRITEESVFGRILLHRSYSDKLQIQPVTLQSPLIFLPNGNVNKSGTILVTYGKQTYKIVFLLGKGRFYVQKL
ncbi:competence type IV pilus minor pilin ComGD [Paranoxybacillus vitaminiphilus]|nr:competence type IV pilus minor pilin ComGD [Anoxybacillus vitaminiphilus]